MTRYAEVNHSEWIAAPVEVVRNQFADLDHHIARNVHPRLRFEVVQRWPGGARFVQKVRLLGIRQRDVFERSIDADGSMHDRSVEGFNRGAMLDFSFAARHEGPRIGTQVDIRVRLPLLPVVGRLLRPLLEAQIRREVRAATLEDKHDIEVRGYSRGGSASIIPSGSAPEQARSSAHFDLVSHWRIRAPVERVWAALTDPTTWPRWWPYVRRVQTLRDGGKDGVGSVRRIDWSTRLPYRLAIDVESVESVLHRRLRGLSRGQLVGEGIWLLRSEGGVTDVTYVWRVRLTRPWMRWLAPLLAPVFRWNHDGVMRAGESGLRGHLESAASASGR
ncbi:MAG: SRPBCC family protein [Proteobacteria bacterium]|nr:SRPBCC family protein [Pseudomonadota bacterium]